MRSIAHWNLPQALGLSAKRSYVDPQKLGAGLRYAFALLFIAWNGSAQISFTNLAQKLDTSQCAWEIQLADLDGDRVLDAYLNGAIWHNDGTGKFTKSSQSFGPPNRPAYFADVNGDGWIDAVCDNTVYLNDGHFGFSQTKAIPCDIPMLKAVLADLNNDGRPDLIVASENQDRLLFNDGQGNFTNTQLSLGGWGQSSYAIGDINGDGITDIYVGIPHTPPPTMVHATNMIWLGNGQGGFTSRTHNVPNALTRAAVLADFNGDGKLDLFLGDQGDWGNYSKAFFNDGSGNFTNSNQNLGTNIRDAKGLDFNNDGRIDLLLARGPFGATGWPANIWTNNGSGRFYKNSFGIGSDSAVLAQCGDLDGDGKPDVMAIHVQDPVAGSAYTDVWLNNSRLPPRIRVLPAKQAGWPGGSNTFDVSAWGDGPFQYQWQCYGTNLLSATNSTLELTDVKPADIGPYSVVVRNSYGAMTSNPAILEANLNHVKLCLTAPGQVSFQCWKDMALKTEASTNLIDWKTMASLSSLTGKLEISEEDIAVQPHAFYRALISQESLPSSATATDIDSNEYHTVTIGSQVWMVEDLKTTRYRNGDLIGTTDPASLDISNQSSPKYQWAYAGDENNVRTYGRLYTWYAVTDSRKIAPVGWHVATENEWKTLINFLGGERAAQGKLKEAGTNHWHSPNSDANNESGFTALPGGNRYDKEAFLGQGDFTHWWTATAYDAQFAWRRTLWKDAPMETTGGYADKKIGWLVRCVKDAEPAVQTNDYFGQSPPSETPVVFARGIVSTDEQEHSAPAFSPDGNEVFWWMNRRSGEGAMMTMRRVGDKWPAPTVAPYGGVPAFSPDGKRLYFEGSSDGKAEGPYFVEKQGDGWSEEKCDGLVLHFPELKFAYNFSLASNGTLYFLSYAAGRGLWNNFGIYRSELINGERAQPELLPPSINASGSANWTPFIAPDESYLIFASSRGKPEDDRGDLYVCFRQPDGNWTKPASLGAPINSNVTERFPAVSPDGKYLFFTRWTPDHEDDVFWVSAGIIDKLKSKVKAKTPLEN